MSQVIDFRPRRSVATPAPARAIGAREGARYGLLGAALAFVALPLYVLLPAFYAERHGVPLAALGALLLVLRAADALIDPALGRAVDAAFARSPTTVRALLGAGVTLLLVGFPALFLPPAAWRADTQALLLWCGASLAITYLGYSLLAVLHQAWGTRLGGDAAQRAQVAGWREALALAGVLVASVLPAWAGVPAMVIVFVVLLPLGALALAGSTWPAASTTSAISAALAASGAPSCWQPWRVPAFRRLLAVYLVNGIAGAVPATLVLFFIRDRLQAPAAEPLCLGLYFLAGALSVPVWVRAVARFGLARSWCAGMVLAVAAFAGAALLGPGDVALFALICVASGLALGADLTVPAALLTGVVQRAGLAGRGEGVFGGWWTGATKLNLALAAGLALPLLQALGYEPGHRDAAGLQALTLAYAALPCALKLVAAALAWRLLPTDDAPTARLAKE